MSGLKWFKVCCFLHFVPWRAYHSPEDDSEACVLHSVYDLAVVYSGGCVFYMLYSRTGLNAVVKTFFLENDSVGASFSICNFLTSARFLVVLAFKASV